ncbi:MAG: uroporphyrinogen decarboxylase family protein [Planctomycetota bacterium]
MTSRRDLVRQAIQFKSPARVPLWFVNADQAEGDCMVYHLSLNEVEGTASQNEWGYRLESLGDGTMGQPAEPHLPDLSAVETFRSPPLNEEERLAAAPSFFEECGDRYRLASLDLSGFTVYTLLRGFENSMEDFLLDVERFGTLMDRIINWECDVAALAARHGFDGIHFADDWGTQSGLMISPGMWRRLFKPRYGRQFALAHEAGLDVWFHCCGNFAAIAEDFHEIGVDVLNIAQPNVVDVAAVGERLRGKQCFLMPISYQTVSIRGTPEEIYAEARRLYDLLGVETGGFIGYVEEYSSMGMSEENYRACAQSFRRLKA